MNMYRWSRMSPLLRCGRPGSALPGRCPADECWYWQLTAWLNFQLLLTVAAPRSSRVDDSRENACWLKSLELNEGAVGSE